MQLAKNKIIIGRTDKIDLPDLGLSNIQAKIDTGAYTSAIHCSGIHFEKAEDGSQILCYTISGARLGKGQKAQKFKTLQYKLKKIRSSNGELQARYIVKTRIILFGKIFKVEFSLSDRSHMKNPILLGRKLLNDKFVVDVSEEDLSFGMKE